MHTLPPWTWVSVGWGRRTRHRAQEPTAPTPRYWDDQYAIYRVRKHRQHFIRLDLHGKKLVLNRPWAGTDAPAAATGAWRLDGSERPPRRNFDIMMSMVEPVSRVGFVESAGPTSLADTYTDHGYIAAGATAVTILFLFFCVLKLATIGESRAERYEQALERDKLSKQESDEWWTPSVTASSLGYSMEVGSLPRLDDAEMFARQGACSRIVGHAPPPYSACPYVASSLLQDGSPLPQVHARRPQNLLKKPARSATHFDNVQNVKIENGIATAAAAIALNNTDQLNSGVRTELVFADGGVLERVSSDISTNNDKTAGNDAEEPTKDKVVDVDETASNNATADRIPLV